jgi:tetratricopeptide (TPR) repeat protein
MKTGRYGESINNYKKALSFNPNFVASHIGIATNLNFMGKHADSRKQLQKLHDIARNDGERRASYFATVVSYADEGHLDKALEQAQRLYTSNKRINDAAAMAGNLVLMGNILLEMDRPDEAMSKFEKAVQLVQKSDLSTEVKENNKRLSLFNLGRVVLKKGDFAAAKAKSKEFHRQVEAINNPNQIRLSHQLAGMIALAEKNYDRAIQELQRANQQNPYNLYRMALAYEGKGDRKNTKELCKNAAYFNGLNNLNYAFIRSKAKDMLTSI